jgi:hypothetical protein
MKHSASQFVTILAFTELIQNSSMFALVRKLPSCVQEATVPDSSGTVFTSGSEQGT